MMGYLFLVFRLKNRKRVVFFVFLYTSLFLKFCQFLLIVVKIFFSFSGFSKNLISVYAMILLVMKILKSPSLVMTSQMKSFQKPDFLICVEHLSRNIYIKNCF